MKKYFIKRFLQIPMVLLGVLICVFLIVQISPGDPAVKVAGPSATPEQIEIIRTEMGLNEPLPQQFINYLLKVAQGDFGKSYVMKTEVKDGIFTAFSNTVYLIIFARIWSVLAAIPLGILAAVKQNTVLDKLSMNISLLGVSIPEFWLALMLMLMLLFSFKLRWLPFSGMGEMWTADGFKHLILPAFMLGMPQLASIARMTRSEMLEVLQQDYIRTARAKGLLKSVVVCKHALKNAALPLVTIIGTQTGYMLSGSVVIETIFAWPGLGRYSINAIIGCDYPAIQASILLFALLFLVINLIVDMTLSLVDPRIK